MSNSQIETSFVEEFAATVDLLLQQKGSLLTPLVNVGAHRGKKASVVDQFGKATAVKRTTRNGDTPNLNLDQARRWVIPADYEWGTLIDDQDRLRMIIDPTSPIALAAAAGQGRARDDVIIDAFHGTAYTGEDGTTAESWSTSYDVAVTVGGTASQLNSAKLKNAIRLLITANEGELMEPVSGVISSYEHDSMLKEIEAIGSDYGGNAAILVDGRIRRFMGVDFTLSERLKVVSGNREVPVFVKSGMHLGIWDNGVTEITPRADKSYSVQVYNRQTIGATRTQLGKIIKVICDDGIA